MAAFVKHTSCDECGSSDGKAIYSDLSSFCFVCQHTVPSQEYIEENRNKKTRVKTKKESDLEIKPSGKPALTQEENADLKEYTTPKANGFRAIRDEIYTTFGVRHEIHEDTNEVLKQYYPCTQEGQLVGYKIREVPKSFSSIGRTGAECELFMQFKFNRGGKYVMICEGEVDSLSAFQMLSDYSASKGGDFVTAVVSPTTGANSMKQIAAQYKFLDTFENIILCYDNDKAGQDAVEKIIPVLPKGKVKIMKMRYKDANEYLEKGKDRQFVHDFYDAEKPVPVGVMPSSELYGELVKEAHTKKIPLPPFFGNLGNFLKGGVPLGHIMNIAAATSLGKTTVVNELIYYWLFNSPHLVGIVSMELSSGQYAEALLSRHIGKKLALIENEEEKIAYLERPDVKEKADVLFKNENGDPRFYLLDNRDASVEEIQGTVEELVVSCGCKVIVIDVLQDIIASLTNEEQEKFLKWSKGLIKSHGVSLIYVNHTRKTAAGQNAADDEQSIHGSSSIIKSASINIMLKRDKMAEDPIERNKTEVLVHKNRIYGLTGSAGFIYYDNETHTLHNFDDWANEHLNS